MRLSMMRSSVLCLLVLAAVAVCPSRVFSQDAEAPKTDDTKVVTDQMILNNEREIETMKRLYEEVIKVLKEDETLGKAITGASAAEKRNRNGDMPEYDTLDEIIASQFGSQNVTQQIAGALNIINDQVIWGHTNVQSNSSFKIGGNDEVHNAFSEGTLEGIDDAYRTHIQIFCIKGTENAPEKCGDERELAGVFGSENFVDFLLGERTWNNVYVLDTMKLARLFFGIVPEIMHTDAVLKRKGAFVNRLRNVAQASLRMAVINELASRRAPSNEAVSAVLGVMLRSLQQSGEVSSDSYEEVCSKKPNEMKAAERVVCGYTSKPPDFRTATTLDPGVPRQISQTVLDKVTQYDLYMSPYFYQTVNSSAFSGVGAMDKLEVFIKAQQLTQDYRQLQLIKMRTALTAARMGAQDNKPKN